MDNLPLILGIESSCDETAAAVVRGPREVLSNVIASQHHLHEKFGGVVPEIASRAHIERIIPVIEKAINDAGIHLADLQAIAVGNRPGLIGSLLVGLSAAKTLAWALDKPLVGVDHVRAHLFAGALDAAPIQYPALGLVVSGGHTSLYAARGPLDMQLLGRTIDDAVGEAYDKVASILQLGYPGGPALDKRAQQGDPSTIQFPRSLLDPDSLDFSFSGLKTAVLYQVRGKPLGRGAASSFQRDASHLSEKEITNIAASFQEAAVDVLITKIERALLLLQQVGSPPHSLLIGGGVSANSLLRKRATEFGSAFNLDVRLPRMAYCLDNAAMIAGLGAHRFMDRGFDDLSLPAIATTSL